MKEAKLESALDIASMMRVLLCLLAFTFNPLVDSRSVPAGERMRSKLREFVRPDEPDFSSVAEPPGSVDPPNLYQRKTQSPVIWLNLRKTKFPAIQPSWYNQPYAQEAKQLLGQMDMQMAALSR